MGFVDALALVRQLEGGKTVDAGGATNQGITQATWAALGFKGSVMNATEAQIAVCYRKLWDGVKVYDEQTQQNRSLFDLLPDVADAVAFQFFINVPPSAFLASFQAAVLEGPDGKIGPKTQIAMRTSTRDELLRGIMTSQILHYVCHSDSADLPGLLHRVETVRLWSVKQD